MNIYRWPCQMYGINSISAFPSDFIHSDSDSSDVPHSLKILKQFDTSRGDLFDQPGVREYCEDYCATSNECWGCSLHCNATCRWSAIAALDQKDAFTEMTPKLVSQKPGNGH